MIKWIFFPFLLLLLACKSKVETINPTFSSITESIYASGMLKSKNQYQAFSSVNGVIEQIYVSEGDTLKKGTKILLISNETQKLMKENAELAATFSDVKTNQGKLNEAKQNVELSKSKMMNDSVLFMRQTSLWKQQIGTKVELEQRELNYKNSKNVYLSSLIRYKDLVKQITFNASQSQKNLQISSKQANDYLLKSEIDGIVYSINKSKGEFVTTQTPIATIGDAKNFILEMQVDEYDILKIREGLLVFVTMDSYKGSVFEAKVTKINPIMNERSKTFTVEAEFINKPKVLYPNISFEANIVLQEKNNVLLIPRDYLLNDSTVINADKKQIKIKTGLRDYQKIEVISGLSKEDKLIKPLD